MSQENQTQPSSKAGGPKGLYVGIAVGIIVIVALAVAVVYLILRSNTADRTQTDENRTTILTSENFDEVMSEMDEPVVAGSYVCNMNTTWHFTDSSSPSYDAYVANAEENSYTVYFDVTLADTEQLVYSSPYMEVGAELADLKLSEKLDAGEYPAIVTYHLVDDQHVSLSTVSVSVTLIVEN
jgi:hypothetical protein